jgi:hypothetical protein
MDNLDKTTLLALAAATSESLSEQGVSWGTLKQVLRDQVARDPLDALFTTVAGAALLFWLAERETNENCRTYEDALVFISTCLDVGYAHVVATTREGKAIAAIIMTIGPAMAAAALKPPREEERKQEEESQRAILGKLDAILCELRARRAQDSS